jgi:hypothetical protein
MLFAEMIPPVKRKIKKRITHIVPSVTQEKVTAH